MRIALFEEVSHGTTYLEAVSHERPSLRGTRVDQLKKGGFRCVFLSMYALACVCVHTFMHVYVFACAYYSCWGS